MNLIEEKLKDEYKDNYLEIIDGLKEKRIISFRVNLFKSNLDEIVAFLDSSDIKYMRFNFYNLAFGILDKSLDEIKELSIYKEGKIYLQSLSSMIPPLFLDLKSSKDILDMCAAPGSKTSQIAQMVLKDAHIMALEKDKIRSQRLEHNLAHLGVKNVTALNQSALLLDDYLSFDTILLDAPCTGIGTIDLNNESDYKYYSDKLLKEISKTQVKLLNKALKILKKGHTMIYSTCSLNKEENENILNQCLKQNNADIVKIEFKGDNCELLESSIDGVIKVKPNRFYEGFFIAKIIKK